MSEDWDKLAEAFANHPVALIGKVDCTSDDGEYGYQIERHSINAAIRFRF